MGMDVVGTEPMTEAGRYFRNNVWWWRPLVDYVQSVAPKIACHCKYWQTNDGDGLDAGNSLLLAENLREEIDAGRCALYAANHDAARVAIARQVCPWCSGSGVRTDAVGVENRMPLKLIDAPGHPRHGANGWCNGCDGTGTRESLDAGYPFSVENVESFCTFLEGCGGFKIY